MVNDWDFFEIGKIVDTAAEATDRRLASRISCLTRMTGEEVQELFPKPADVEKLEKLMRIVKSAEDKNKNDWDFFEIDNIVDTAAEATDRRLASRISCLTRMTGEEVQELFPKPADVEKLGKLMRIVKSAEDKNKKVDKIVSDAEEFVEIIIKLVDKFV